MRRSKPSTASPLAIRRAPRHHRTVSKRAHNLALLAFLAVALTTPSREAAHAQDKPTTVLVVNVGDDETGQALQGAEVLLPGLGRSARTDALGEARIGSIPSGPHRIRVRFLGFAPMDTTLQFEGDTAAVLFRLERAVVALDAVEVKAASPMRLRDFEMRRKIGSGKYLTAVDLERDSNRPFGIVAMTRFPGLQFVYDADGRPHVSSTRGACGGNTSPSEELLAGARGGGSGGRGAATTGGTPGQSQGKGGSGQGAGNTPGAGETRTYLGSCSPGRACYVVTFLDDIQLDNADFDIVTTWDIAAVEYYTGNSVPPRYRVSGAACGVLLVWSK